jgi:hypothetical protein
MQLPPEVDVPHGRKRTSNSGTLCRSDTLRCNCYPIAMSYQDSLDAIALLLMNFPGVSSAAGFLGDDEAVSIYFRCADFESLKVIGSCAVAANVPVSLGDPKSRLCYEESEVEDCPFRVLIDDDRVNEGPPSTSQIFGVHLARSLKSRGLIEAEFSDRLQTGWNAIPL